MRAYALARERRRPLLHGLVLGLVLLAAFVSFFLSKSFPFHAQASVPITGLSLPSIGAAPAAEPVLVSPALPGTVRREEASEALVRLAASDGAGTLGGASGEAAGSGTGVDTPAPAPTIEPYALYAVQSGDSAGAIAGAFGVDLQYLLWANPDLRDGDLVSPGQLLVIPAGNGILYDVRFGDTLSDIAARYGVPVGDILAWPGNNVQSPDQVVDGALIYIPNGIPPASILPAEAPPAQEAPVLVEAPPADVPAPADPGPVSTVGLVWPVYGPISSYMDYSHPLGIDIDLFNNVGAPIGAATGGTVTFAGGDPCCSYGLYVVIMSPGGGIETLYAHFSSIAVSQGQQVSAGQTLGYSGCTGYCTGTHLHFEVIDNGVRVNPLAYLP